MTFYERTEAEQGFSALWDKEIEPSLDAYRIKYRPRFWLAALGQPAAIFIAIMLYEPLLSLEKPDTEFHFAALSSLLIAVALMFAFYYPFSKITGSFDEFLKHVVSEHYGDILLAADNDKNATFLIDQMQAFNMMEHGRRSLTNHYVGTYRDCELEIFNICLTSGYGKQQSSYYYFIIDVTVPIAFDGDVVIKSDYGRILNFFRGLFSKRKQVNFDHPAFEKSYEVYAEDASLARRLISPAFCDNLLAIPQLFPRSYGVMPAKLNGAFHQGHFTLAVPGNADLFSLLPHQSTPGKIETACRRLIARMGIVKSVVDYLHGAR